MLRNEQTAGHHPRTPPRRDRRRRRASAVAAGRVRGAGTGEELAADRDRRGQGSARDARPHAVLRPARPRQDHARHAHGARDGRAAPHHLGPRAREAGRPRRSPHVARSGRHALHRRDPPDEAGARGVPLPGHGGLPGGRPHRRRAPRADHPDGARALHADRRDDPLRAADPADARPLRAGRAARVLSARATCSGSSPAAPRSSRSRPTRPAPPRSPAGAAARRGWPTACSAGCATTRR